MAKQTYLIRRGAVYYFRLRVPTDIAKTYGKREELFSLKTKDYQEAIKRVRKEVARIENQFEQHREELKRTSSPRLKDITSEQLKHIHDVYYQYRLEEDEETRLEGFYRGTQRKTPTNTFSEYTEMGETLTSITKSDYAQGVTEGFYEGEAIEVISWSNVCLNIEEGSLAHKKISRTLQEASIRAQKAIGERNEGSIVETPETPKASAQENSNAPLLSAVMEEWIEDKSRAAWRPKTAREHRVWATHFINMVGDKPINEYTKSNARDYKNTLSTLPPSWSLKKELKGLRIDKAAKKAIKLDMPPMSISNLNKILCFTGSLWNWMLKNYDEVETNPFIGLTVTTTESPRAAREGFTIEELNTIFSAPIYTGCVSERKWSEVGNYSMVNTARYWTPLISLYSGMRMDEILQLRFCDIRTVDDIHYFDINADDGKTLKNNSSHRNIPIHDILIQCGLLEFIKRKADNTHCKDTQERIFDDAQKGNDGTYSYIFSKFFSRFLTNIKVKTKKNSFHSFRHTFEDACRENDIPKEIMDALQGHSSQDMSDRYGAGYSVQKLNEWLQKVDYGGLEVLREDTS
ncbi:MAG: DUF6538 domain-containing protein [Alphaproteobacteria bacterium]